MNMPKDKAASQVRLFNNRFVCLPLNAYVFFLSLSHPIMLSCKPFSAVILKGKSDVRPTGAGGTNYAVMS